MLGDVFRTAFLEDFLPIDVLPRGILLGDAFLGDIMLVENFAGRVARIDFEDVKALF